MTWQAKWTLWLVRLGILLLAVCLTSSCLSSRSNGAPLPFLLQPAAFVGRWEVSVVDRCADVPVMATYRLRLDANGTGLIERPGHELAGLKWAVGGGHVATILPGRVVFFHRSKLRRLP